MFTLRLSKCMRLMYVFPRSAVSICDLCVYLLMCVSCLGVCVSACACVGSIIVYVFLCLRFSTILAKQQRQYEIRL